MKLLTAVLALAGAAVALPAGADEALAKKHNCLACHQVDKKVIGPSYRDIAKKYKGQNVAAQLEQLLEAAIGETTRRGGKSESRVVCYEVWSETKRSEAGDGRRSTERGKASIRCQSARISSSACAKEVAFESERNRVMGAAFHVGR